ncbi:sulfatase family protein [Rhodopirellula europaea 6C]|uniref:Sulfatase family protein n=2 Tax=Rhodopirellula TaxID=265488 RepID=M2AG40_9BACT|nr:sulfatase family protein [Rhodopirellula europaea 6C]
MTRNKTIANTFLMSPSMSRLLLTVALMLSSCLAATAEDIRVLFLGDDGPHKPQTRFAIVQPALQETGITVTYTDQLTDLNRQTLGQYDALMVYANHREVSADQARAVIDYVAAGGGFVPLHCATACFRNSPELIALMGAQFKSHGRGDFSTKLGDNAGEVLGNVLGDYQPFASWDESYVHHRHNDVDRTVLEYRYGAPQAEGNQREPWTWVRTHGKGRVFYTAWGHDERTWSKPEFQGLVERGVRWVCRRNDTGVADAGQTLVSNQELPPIKSLPSDLEEFDYVDVGPKIPNYAAGRGETLNLMQQPAPAEESMRHLVTPEGFSVELFADESMLSGKMFGGKPIAMNWDAQGRLWVCETVDYPNELQPTGTGRDRVRVIEDTDGDFRADKSTVFAEDLSIPTALAFHRGGVVVQNGVETLFLKDTDGDGKADVRKVLISNWSLGDTHGGVSNFRNGLDNWIWAMQGYNTSSPVINGEQQPSFRMGWFRFKLSQDDDPVVEKLEFIRSTKGNTWGLGFSEEGLIFGSTANRRPSFFMPIANRYYERVRGWAPDTLEMIAPTHIFEPITDKVRQVDCHGGYTAAAGHALYTARNYPAAYWNRTAFVCGPTGKLVGTFVIERDGAGMKSHSPNNLLASDDEWTAPIMAEVGPDGNVWVLDWYNYIVQHNPVPQGFERGKGNAYETDLRDKKYGRVYRVVPDGVNSVSGKAMTLDSPAEDLIAGLKSPTMLVRLNAQRLLVEQGSTDITDALIQLIDDQSMDSVGLNTGAIHALNTLHGLGLLNSDGPALTAATKALTHPSAGVRLNAVRVLPESQATVDEIAHSKLTLDPDHQVVLASLLKVSDTRAENAGAIAAEAAALPAVDQDPWLCDAVVTAGAMHVADFLVSVLSSEQQLGSGSLESITRVSEHFARTSPDAQATGELLSLMAKSKTNANEAIIVGVSRGWPREHKIKLGAQYDSMLTTFFESSSLQTKGMLARLAPSLSSAALEDAIGPMIDSMIDTIEDDDAPIESRIEATNRVVALSPGRVKTIDALFDMIGPQSPTSLSLGLMNATGKSSVPGVGPRLIEVAQSGTPSIRDAVMQLMLSRADWTNDLLASISKGDLRFTDLTAQQRSALQNHPTIDIRRRVDKLMREGGLGGKSNRGQLVKAKMPLVERTGDVDRGKAVFTKNCATCHVFKGEGNVVGPNLNGMSVHPKVELLTHILDPNSSVEANYRLYNVLTADGLVISGLLSGETLTSIEMVDAQGKRHTVLREDIEELVASTKSAMPEGLEQSVNDDGLVDLLEYLTQADQFIPLGLESVANISSAKGMFNRHDNNRERLIMPKYGFQAIDGIPFQLIDPSGSATKNAVMLHGPRGSFPPKMPKSVSVRCKAEAAKVHMLGGVAGWAAKSASNGGVSMIVRLRYADGQTEDHSLISGQHIADYIGQFDVPQSKLAMKASDGGQVRYLAITPKRKAVIDTIEFVKPEHVTAPLIFAVTIERPGNHTAHAATVSDEALAARTNVGPKPRPAPIPAGSNIKRNYGDKPNILFIAIDDLNDHVGYMGGYPGVITPNFDRLASMGTAFTNAHCAAPICNPSRTSIMFGVRPSTSGVYGNAEKYRQSPALANALTLPEYLRKRQGYWATGAGKIFHALEWIGGISDGKNDIESWDSFWPTMTRQMPHRVMPENAPLGRGKNPGERRGAPPIMDWGPIGHPVESMPDYKVASHISEQLSGSFDKPFFLACGIFRPHIPFYVPQKYLDLYPLDEVRIPDNPEGWLDRVPESVRNNNAAGAARRRWHNWISANGEWKKAVQAYLASVTFADDQLGRVLDALESSPHNDNTIIVLWSDHGAHLGDKETWEKYTLWHESTRVPLVFVAPGVTKPGTVSNQPASLLDVYPTLLELAGIEQPGDQLEGTSLVPQLKNPQAAKEPVVCTHQLGNHAVISSTHRYIRYANGDEELYDLVADPAEWNNVAEQESMSAVKAELQKGLPKVNFQMSPGQPRPKAVPKRNPANRRQRVTTP